MRTTRSPAFSRRALLGGAAVVGLVAAGCTTGVPKPVVQPPPDPLEDLLAAHVALAIRYDEAGAVAPSEPLSAQRAQLGEQVAALAGALAVHPPQITAAPSDGSSGTSASSSAPASTPPDPAAVLAQLATEEAALAEPCRALAISEPVERAPLLASLAAAHTVSAAALS